jgi:excinuclease ABC subunit B
MSLVAVAEADYVTPSLDEAPELEGLSPQQRAALIADMEKNMRAAAKAFEFEKAAAFRDRIQALKVLSPFDGGNPPNAAGAE